ncbi:MAG: hypothetical protein NTV36_02040 [Candidatus Staskawiczbacteria bacterium]|nr:hypothetical protein [Candidatus Staskawiczbacteria bacterium]
MKKIILILFICFLVSLAGSASAHQPRLIYLQKGEVKITSPEVSQAFYDELKGQPKDYFIDSDKDFNLYLNLLVPEEANKDGRYSAKIFMADQQAGELDAGSVEWKEMYESFGRDYYLQGPELDKQVLDKQVLA